MEASGMGRLPQGEGLFGDLLDRFTEIVGPSAAKATFHYASHQEGMRIGSQEPSLTAALARIDVILAQESRLEEETADRVRIAVKGSPLLASDNPVRVAVVHGILEGVLKGRKTRTFTLSNEEHLRGATILTFTGTD